VHLIAQLTDKLVFIHSYGRLRLVSLILTDLTFIRDLCLERRSQTCGGGLTFAFLVGLVVRVRLVEHLYGIGLLLLL